MGLVYMDHSATTPLDPKVFQAMRPFLSNEFGNPSSSHSLGQRARRAVEQGREEVASLINASPDEIIFTSGGTEADNQAIITYMMLNQHRGNHLVTSAIEHHAVLDTCRYLESQGFEVTIIPVDQAGRVDPDTLRKALRISSTLVSIMHGNNEVGTIQAINELAAIAHEKGAAFHTDAVQTVGKIPVDVQDLGVDLLSASSHKLYGPKGVGCLFVRKGVAISTYLHGGGQEQKLRAGTENVPGIVGFGRAAHLAKMDMEARKQKLRSLGKRLSEGILTAIPKAKLTGHPVQRVPGSISLCFEGISGKGGSITAALDEAGIMASSASACTCGAQEPSHVLLALGLSREMAQGALRLTLGKDNSEADVEKVLKILPRVISDLRNCR